MRDIVVKYVAMVLKQICKHVNLQIVIQAPTPFLLEDQKVALSGLALSDKKVCVCPFCMQSFPVWDIDEEPPSLLSASSNCLDANAKDFPLCSPICDNLDCFTP